MIKIPEQFKIKEQIIHNTYLINGEISIWDGDFVDVYSTLLTENEDDNLFKLGITPKMDKAMLSKHLTPLTKLLTMGPGTGLL